MKKTFLVVWCLSLILIPHLSLSDTLVLKSGKTIQSSSCWEDGDLFKCKVYGQVIGYQKSDVVQVQIDASTAKPTAGFKFDIWQSGISVDEAIGIAETNNKPFIKSGLISIIKEFHPNTCRPYADTATKFYYKDQILGRWATLNFDFTPTSKRLHTFEVAFSGPGISKKSEFREQVETMLRGKYGDHPKFTDQIIIQNYTWKLNKNASVTMRLGGNSVHVIYKDDVLVAAAENERLKQVQVGFNKSDRHKF